MLIPSMACAEQCLGHGDILIESQVDRKLLSLDMFQLRMHLQD